MTCNDCRANADRTRTAEAMCYGCDVQPECPTYAAVFIRGVRLDDAEPCPRGRHPDAEGVVLWGRWLCVWRCSGCPWYISLLTMRVVLVPIRWYGAPYPIRLRIIAAAVAVAVRERVGKGERALPGCGCVKPWKDRWERIKLKLKGPR